MHDARSKNVSFVRARGKFQISLRTKGEERSFFISIPILHSNDTFDNFVDSCQISWDFVTKMIETNDLCVEGRKGDTGSKLCCCCEMFSLREKIIFRRKDRKIRLIVNQAWNVLAWETPRFIPLPFSFLSLSLSSSFSFASLRPSPNPSSPPVSPTPSHNRMRFIFSAESIDQLYDSKRQAFHLSKLNVHVRIRAIRIEFRRFVDRERTIPR